MGRTPNALEQSPHDPACGSARASNHVDYREVIPGNGTSTCQPLDSKTRVNNVARIEPRPKSDEEIPDSTAFHPGYTGDKTGTHLSIDKRRSRHSSAMSITARSFWATVRVRAGRRMMQPHPSPYRRIRRNLSLLGRDPSRDPLPNPTDGEGRTIAPEYK
jgi:hypothetical protein